MSFFSWINLTFARTSDASSIALKNHNGTNCLFINSKIGTV